MNGSLLDWNSEAIQLSKCGRRESVRHFTPPTEHRGFPNILQPLQGSARSAKLNTGDTSEKWHASPGSGGDRCPYVVVCFLVPCCPVPTASCLVDNSCA